MKDYNLIIDRPTPSGMEGAGGYWKNLTIPLDCVNPLCCAPIIINIILIIIIDIIVIITIIINIRLI